MAAKSQIDLQFARRDDNQKATTRDEMADAR